MCDVNDNIESIQLVRCAHGNFHLHLGKLTLHLSEREMQLLVRATAAWVESEHAPSVSNKLPPGARPRVSWSDQ